MLWKWSEFRVWQYAVHVHCYLKIVGMFLWGLIRISPGILNYYEINMLQGIIRKVDIPWVRSIIKDRQAVITDNKNKFWMTKCSSAKTLFVKTKFCNFLPLFLSLSHTHTRTHTHTLSPSFSRLSLAPKYHWKCLL